MREQWSRTFTVAMVTLLVFQWTGCGTLLYPERRGLKAGHLDAGVVILDAIGLLFFLIPGIIAFAVDFSNGTIYLPATTPIGTPAKAELKQIKFDPRRTTLADIEKIIKEETGRDVKLTRDNVKVSRLVSIEDMMAHFAQALPDLREDRMVFVR